MLQMHVCKEKALRCPDIHPFWDVLEIHCAQTRRDEDVFTQERSYSLPTYPVTRDKQNSGLTAREYGQAPHLWINCTAE